MNTTRIITLAAAAGFASLALAAGASAATTRYECRASGSPDISMQARYELRGTTPTSRRKFSTEFEAGRAAAIPAGTRLRVVVKGVAVGSAVAEALAGGGIVADLNFDTQRQLDALPFPSKWPTGVGAGSVVRVMRGTTLLLSCTLR